MTFYWKLDVKALKLKKVARINIYQHPKILLIAKHNLAIDLKMILQKLGFA